MDTTGLLNQRIKIVLRRFHPQTPREVVRGIITDVDETGLRVSGRRFQEQTDLESRLPQEWPVEPDSKVYWIPHSSIRYSEIIARRNRTTKSSGASPSRRRNFTVRPNRN